MKVIKYVRRLESKYGSVVNSPEDDPDLLQCRYILRERFLHEFDGNFSDENIVDNVQILLNEGESYDDVANRIGRSSSYVRKLVKANGLTVPKKYVYTVKDKDGNEFYLYKQAQATEITGEQKFVINEAFRCSRLIRGFKYRMIDPLLPQELPPNVFYFSTEGLKKTPNK